MSFWDVALPVADIFTLGGASAAAGALKSPATAKSSGLYTPGPAPLVPQQPPGLPGQVYNFQGDLSKPGAAESYYAANAAKYGQPTSSQGYWGQVQNRFTGGPGQGEQYWNQVQGQFNAPKDIAQNAQDAYEQFEQSTPANTDPYYDLASKKLASSINDQFAARGMFGSSAALQSGADAQTALRVQQAMDEAGYGLQRAGLAGQLATGADVSSARASADQRDWLASGGALALGAQGAGLESTLGGAQIAGQADTSGLQWLNSGMDAATDAQNALRARGQDYFGNQMALSDAQAQAMGQGYPKMFGMDQDLFNSWIASQIGEAQVAADQSVSGRQGTESGILGLFGGAQGVSGAGGLRKIAGGFF